MKIGHIIGGNILFIYDEPKLTSRISGYIGSLTEVTIVTDKAVNGFYKVSTIFCSAKKTRSIMERRGYKRPLLFFSPILQSLLWKN